MTRLAPVRKVPRLRQYGKGGFGETRAEIYRHIMGGRDFDSGNLSGRRQVNGTAYYHPELLPKPWRERINEDQPDYVVWSYGTPIAWHCKDDEGKDIWTIPDERYSATTTRHQGMVRTALAFGNPVTVAKVIEDWGVRYFPNA